MFGAAISDLHLHPHAAHSKVLPNGMNSRLFTSLTAVLAVVEQRPKRLFISGDVFHVRGTLRPSVANVFAMILKRAAQLEVDVCAIPGNHDMEDFKGGATALDVFTSFDNFRLLKSGADGFNSSSSRCNPCICGFQYMHDSEAFLAKFEADMEKAKPGIVLIHQGVDEFRPTANMPETGITASRLNAIIEKTNPNALVLAGHYHIPRRMGRVVSVGSPYPMNFGDAGKEFGFWAINDALEPEFKKLPYPDFVVLRVSKKSEIKKEAVQGNFVKIVAPNIKKAVELREHALELGAESVIAHFEKDEPTAHVAPVKFGDVRSMLVDYITVKGGSLAEKKDVLLKEYEELSA